LWAGCLPNSIEAEEKRVNLQRETIRIKEEKHNNSLEHRRAKTARVSALRWVFKTMTLNIILIIIGIILTVILVLFIIYKMRPINFKEREDILRTFKETTALTFDDFLKDFGFNKVESCSDQEFFTTTYRNGERYIQIGGTLHIRDCPYSFYLKFGEGSLKYPEVDWNGIELLRIIKEVSPTDYKKHKALYRITPKITKEQIELKILKNRELCDKYGKNFLNNDLDLFYRVRSLQNKDREPYKISTSDGKGYSTSYDEQSKRLKDKYS
jgi:hypothetical protein